MTCDICCEVLTKHLRKNITCPYCEHAACLQCYKQYLLTSHTDPCCMNCKHVMSVDFLHDNFEKTFLHTQYKKHREQMLYEKQVALFPATQPLVEKKYKILQMRRELNDLLEKKQKIIKDIQKMYITINKIKYGVSKGIEIEKTHYVRSCPRDSCKGFLSAKWHCGVCNADVCSKCHVIKSNEQEHTCNPDDVATAKLLTKDSKNCPSCSVLIFKIDGCDQMFCTQCHTAFSWKTGVIETKRIHNPHYYEWMRNTNNGVIPREPGDNPCRGNVDIRKIMAILPNKSKKHTLLEAHRIVQHIQYVLIPDLTPADNSAELRIDYMMNNLTLEKFKARIIAQDVAREKKTQMREIFEMFCTVVTDILSNAVNKQITVDEAVDQINVIREYANNSMLKLSTRYKCVVLYITPNFYIDSNYKV